MFANPSKLLPTLHHKYVHAPPPAEKHTCTCTGYTVHAGTSRIHPSKRDVEYKRNEREQADSIQSVRFKALIPSSSEHRARHRQAIEFKDVRIRHRAQVFMVLGWSLTAGISQLTPLLPFPRTTTSHRNAPTLSSDDFEADKRYRIRTEPPWRCGLCLEMHSYSFIIDL